MAGAGAGEATALALADAGLESDLSEEEREVLELGRETMTKIGLQACADCGGPIGQDDGPPDGWQLEGGRTVCHGCCAKDLESQNS